MLMIFWKIIWKTDTLTGRKGCNNDEKGRIALYVVVSYVGEVFFLNKSSLALGIIAAMFCSLLPVS